MGTLEVDTVHFYEVDNAKQHHTDKYEVVHNTPPTPVLRRGQPFFLALRFKNRDYQEFNDVVKLVFSYGEYSNKLHGLFLGKEIYG